MQKFVFHNVVPFIYINDEIAFSYQSKVNSLLERSNFYICLFISEKMDQDPPTIIQRGYSDDDPVSPNKYKNTILGALLGMIVACGIVTLSFLLNDTVMTEEDITKKLGLNVLGVIPYEEEEKTHGRIARKNAKNTRDTKNKMKE